MMCGRGFRKFISKLRNEEFLKGYIRIIYRILLEFYTQYANFSFSFVTTFQLSLSLCKVNSPHKGHSFVIKKTIEHRKTYAFHVPEFL
jgi:hypothetical protein